MDDPYAFDQIPRGRLALRVSRRGLLQALAHEVVVLGDQRRGAPTARIADLGEWPDEQIAELVAEVVPGCVISVRDGFVWGRPPRAERPRRLFPLDSPAVAAFNLFNGSNTLGAVGRRLAESLGWEPARGLAYVRGLFLCLGLAGVCQPGAMG